MKPYIYTARDRIHIFDLVKTKKGLEEAAAFAKATAANGSQILFVGTKRQAQDIIKEDAQKVGMPYISERWIGGLLTNWDLMKKRLAYLADLKSGMAEGRFKDRTKKENILIKREIAKMERVFGGVSGLTAIPAAIFVADAKKEAAAINEAKARGAKTIAIVDTNANPEGIDYIIPSNDDASKCLELLIGTITEAIEEGIKQSKVKVTEEKKVEEKAASAPVSTGTTASQGKEENKKESKAKSAKRKAKA